MISSACLTGLSTEKNRFTSKTKPEAGASMKNAAVSSKTDTWTLPDSVVANIQQMARKDAGSGVYMDQKFLDYNRQYMHSHVSPDRSGLISLLTPMLTNARYTNGLPTLFQISGLPFTAKLQVGVLTGASLSVCDGSGTEILSYDGRNGWLSHSSKEENRYQAETTAIYHEAYAAARVENKAAQGTGYDVKA